MQIHVNTDRHIESDDALREKVKDSVRSSLSRFGEQITRVEVHLSDLNAQKGGRDTRCVIEARMAGFPPVTVDDTAHEVDGALRNATGKLIRALETRRGKRGHR